MSKLVLAEKPSVAQALSKVLGATRRGDGYLEGNGYVVSWCVGHLVELAPPEAYNDQYKKWRREDLPIFPRPFRYQVSAATKKQFEILKKLMARDDVESLVCATDAGREGELIFRLVYHQCRCRKPFERLWISSMEDSAIREGFKSLRPSKEYDALYEAALCRERADWIVGINATRLFSCLYGTTLNTGRVLSPTLAMAVEREAAIAAFQPETFYQVQLHFGFIVSGERMKTREEAQNLAASCQKEGSARTGKITQAEKKEKSPALYDLTTLQREANRVLGYTAQQTLDYTQALYEKKLVTYPRTDSRYLTEDMAEMLPDLVSVAADACFSMTSPISVNAGQVINSKKVSDHHAIIPTKEVQTGSLSDLPKGELEILRLVAKRLLVAVSDPCRYAETTVEISCGGIIFKAKGKTVLSAGWKEIEEKCGTKKNQEKENVLPYMEEGADLPLLSAEVKEGKTAPPKHFTEDTLLQSMETAGADKMPDEAERRGIGTPATRAGIIEKLVQKGFLERRGNKKTRYLIPTQKGTSLITILPEQIQSPSMTADWEKKLLLIEQGDYSAETFMEEICAMIQELTDTYEVVKGADVLMQNHVVIGNCPHCRAEVVERGKGWFCSNRECRFILWADHAFFNKIGKRMTKQIAEKLVRDGRVKLKDCRSQKTGKTYNAAVLLETENDGRPRFKMEFEDRRKSK